MFQRLILRRGARVVWPGAWPAGLRLAATKVAIVLVPSYTAAWLTDKMVYVVPTLAASGIIAAQISFGADTQRRTDDGADPEDDADDGDSPTDGAGTETTTTSDA